MVLTQKHNNDGTSELWGSPKHGLIFSTSDPNIGMLEACRESRHVAVKAYPVHLPAKDNSKEIRVGSDDVVMIGDIDRLLMMVKEVSLVDRTRCYGTYGLTAFKVTDLYPAAFAKLKALVGVRTLAFVAAAEDDNASM